MNDRIEEIKAYSKKGIDYREDVPFLIGEIERLKMMLDASETARKNLQKWRAEDVARLTSELSSAVADLNICGNCDTCKHDTTLACNIDGETGVCNFEWRGMQK